MNEHAGEHTDEHSIRTLLLMTCEASHFENERQWPPRLPVFLLTRGVHSQLRKLQRKCPNPDQLCWSKPLLMLSSRLLMPTPDLQPHPRHHQRRSTLAAVMQVG